MKKERSNIQMMWKLIGLVKPLTGYMILAIGMGLTGNLCATFLTVLGGYGILRILGFSVTWSLPLLFTFAVVFAVVRGFLRYAEQACNHFIAFKLLALIRDKVFAALRRLCPAKLEGRDKGNLITMITSDIELLEVFYAHTISPCAIAFLYTIVMCAYIGSFGLLFGVIALAAYIVVGVVIPVVMSRLGSADGKAFRAKSGALGSFVLDSLRGLQELLQYGQGQQRLAQMQKQTEELLAVEERMKGKQGSNAALTNGMIWFFDMLLLLTAAWMYQAGLVDFAGVLLPVLALMSSFGPVVALANLGSTLGNTFAAGHRVLDLLEEEPVVEEIQGNPERSFAGVTAINVNFSYEEQQILDHFSLEIPKGSMIGLTGKSGSGKSTFLKLLMRFWEVQEGDIRISGEMIGKINTENLRHMESFVTQETQLFSDSIANNLRVAKRDATMEELEKACRKASIHDVIMGFPQGYDTPVGELGDTLSGGERQRIGLARAFLHDADLLLLDEPTSNLDSLNEGVILKALKESAKNKTVLLVSHRASTMGIVDRAYSVENGRMS